MPGAMDDTLKHLTELSPQDWVVQGGWPSAPARIIDADIATISGATDKVIRVTGSPDWLLAVDFQAGHDSVDKPPDMLLYNSALFKRHHLMVRSLLVLVHRGADSPQLTGFYERGFPGESFDVALRYRILRVWQVPAAQWLAGGLGLVPLALLGDVRKEDLPTVVAQVKDRLEREAPPRQAAELWSAAYFLMGLRYEPAFIQMLLRGVRTMIESSTYRATVEEGEVQMGRKMLLRQGRRRFGEPSPQVLTALNALTDVSRLEELGDRLLQVSSWEELLGPSKG